MCFLSNRKAEKDVVGGLPDGLNGVQLLLRISLPLRILTDAIVPAILSRSESWVVSGPTQVGLQHPWTIHRSASHPLWSHN